MVLLRQSVIHNAISALIGAISTYMIALLLSRVLLLLCGDMERNPGPLSVCQIDIDGVSEVTLKSPLSTESDLHLIQDLRLVLRRGEDNEESRVNNLP